MAHRCELGEQLASKQFRKAARALRAPLKAAADHDMDGIHDFRVASRRFREVISAYRHFLPNRLQEDFRAYLRQVTQRLGKARELDVTLHCLDHYEKDCKGVRRRTFEYIRKRLLELRASESRNVDAAVEMVVSPEFGERLAVTLGEIQSKKHCVRDGHVQGLQSRLHTLRVQYLVWEASRSDEALHQTRVAFKKLRYRCEIASSMYSRRMKRQIEEFKAAQDALGQWNDLRVLRGYVHLFSPAAPLQAAVGIPALQALLERDTAVLLERFHVEAGPILEQSHVERIAAFFASPAIACCANDRVEQHVA
ncbi:MAG: hypothetical protein AMXMBFR84_47160 [Candidatus Hydrogenedentota bacterium]